MYVYVVNIQLLVALDLTFWSEMVVRWAMVGATELTPFLNDMYDMFYRSTDSNGNPLPLDDYLIGFRWGMFW